MSNKESRAAAGGATFDLPTIVVVPIITREAGRRRTRWQALGLLAIALMASVFLTLFYIYQHTDTRPPVFVDTECGRIRGVQLRRHLGQTVSAFYGIPFAEAPVGPLRFRKPVAKRHWHPRVLQATQMPPSCYQLLPLTTSAASAAATPQSEDCLFLNVFVPGPVTSANKSISGRASARRAVMIWIHGGAFVYGGLSFHDPSQLAVFGDVIVVSIAYRLGIFGFMHSTHADQVPGNVGLHDQSLAIRWVHQHIGSFGGDAQRVTLFGESAGAISAGLHLISNRTQPFFKRAILQSGSPLTLMTFGIDSGPLNVEKVARALGCPFRSRAVTRTKYAHFTRATYDCLRDADAQSLRIVERDMLRLRQTFGFVPTLDQDFFPNGVHPLEFMRSANASYSPFHANHRELMLGSNGEEGAVILSRVLPSLFPKNTQLPANLTYEGVQQKLAKMAPGREREIRVLFNSIVHEDEKETPAQVALRFSHMIGDVAFLCPNLMLLDSFLRGSSKQERRSSAAGAGVASSNINSVTRTAFLYQFDVRPEQGRAYPWVRTAMHTEEIQFVFGYPFSQKARYTHSERKLSIRMMKYWSNFAKNGYPNDRPGDQRDWPACIDEADDAAGESESSMETRWHKWFRSDHSEQTVSGVPDNKCEHFEPLIEQMRESYRYADL